MHDVYTTVDCSWESVHAGSAGLDSIHCLSEKDLLIALTLATSDVTLSRSHPPQRQPNGDVLELLIHLVGG